MVNAVVPLGEKPNTYGWLQLEKKAAQELQKLIQASPTAASTLMYMVNHMSRSNALVVSQAAIAKGIGAKRESVNRAVRYLVEHNFIQVIKAAGASVYVVNSRVMWQGNREGNAMQPSALTSWPSKASKIRRPSSRPRRSSASLDWLKANGCWWAMNRSTHPIRASSNCRDGGPPVQARRCPTGGGQAKPPRCRWQPAGGSRRVDPRKPGAKRQAGG